MLNQRHCQRAVVFAQRLQIAIEFALQSIWSARRRMWLVVLGVGIGFGAIFSMLIIGSSVQATIQSSLDSLGGDIVTLSATPPSPAMRGPSKMTDPVSPPAPGRKAVDEAVSVETLVQLLRAMEGVEGAAPVYERSSCAFSSQDLEGMQVIQTSTDIQPLLGLQLAQGRGLHPGDRGHNNVLLGSAMLDNLRQQSPGVSVGSVVRSCGQAWRIVGVLRPHPGSDFVQALQINDSALAAQGAQPPQTDRFSTRSVLVRLRPGVDAQVFADQLADRTRHLLPGHAVEAYGAWAFIKSRQEQVSLYARFLAVLGSVSLLVGALGITNMMLVTVSERRAEIGLRMAIGAKPQDIVIQFLCEGVLICAAGAVVGMLMGWGVAEIALALAGFDATLSLGVMLQAALMVMVCGLVAGAYPAQKAATLDPVSSLQA
jgi:putative ABC transport system permease protein